MITSKASLLRLFKEHEDDKNFTLVLTKATYDGLDNPKHKCLNKPRYVNKCQTNGVYLKEVCDESNSHGSFLDIGGKDYSVIPTSDGFNMCVGKLELQYII